MKDVWIDGKKFVPHKPLTESQIKAIDDGSRVYGKYIRDLLAGIEPDRNLVNQQPSLRTKMVLAAVSKAYEIPNEELRKMKVGHVWTLFDKLIEQSRKAKR